jgi:hypothetical protein
VNNSDPSGYGTIHFNLYFSKEFLQDLVKAGITLAVTIIVGYITCQIPILKPFNRILITAFSAFIASLIGGYISRKITSAYTREFDVNIKFFRSRFIGIRKVRW